MPSVLHILFVINPGSGNSNTDWKKSIDDFFRSHPHTASRFELPGKCSIEDLKNKITSFKPDRVIAVGGDGTVKLIAECLLGTGIPIGILPAGSANGMAKELGIPIDINAALHISMGDYIQKIHAIKVNDQLCIHLSDIGFNAYVIKKFESGQGRGMWGYIKAAWKVLWQHYYMQVRLKIGDEVIERKAAMIVIANATRYGSGAIINPGGRLDDELFEVVILKKVAFSEIFKMMVTHKPYNKEKVELLQAQSLHIRSKRKAHFQVDGEYLGKVNTVQAILLPAALQIITKKIK